ncbi:MAG: amidohydrolase family protein [Gaiellaceae bacterium MAG52_C11]|nr:amidohydrolase family protein [Candidatus Gaiellasilicea maunaloa]
MPVEVPGGNGATYRVFDVHQHMPPVRPDGDPEPTPEKLQSRISLMDDWGIDWACLQAPGGWPPTVTSRVVNETLVAYRSSHPDRYIAAIGTVHALGGRREIEELERIAEEPLLDGVAWHHKLQGTNIDHPAMLDALRICQEAGLPAFIHCWQDSGPPEFPWRLADLAEKFPAVTFLALDSMSSMVHTGWLVQIAKHHPNIWFDTAMLSTSGKVLESIVNQIGDDRVLLGCNPFGENANFNYPAPIYDVLYASLPSESKEKILSLNALRLLGIDMPDQTASGNSVGEAPAT